MSSPSQYPILLAEDNPNDLLFIKRAIDRGSLPVILYHVVNGEEAVSYLKGEGQYGDRERYPLPSLVISNMKMPRMNGLQLLQWIRQRSAWRDLPVVVLSSSGDPGEVGQFERLGANSYFVKPVDLNDLVTTLQQVIAFLPPLG
ncbi:response regulator [Cyanobacteria bacterium FACHB-DQ100]|uniref:response regulator n=1 Tax=unclassified Leptolyngbya TaxID=2650499 RepID=UPI001680A476|nr:response regulator [Leptolyngbya sp. FACHB-17]MBD1821124.1 response regulator [Cyanobacteria bacterium FACHB-DQ100]MBD2081385.1 response regulator [Leptolyngbya sp. FACHB-17]